MSDTALGRSCSAWRPTFLRSLLGRPYAPGSTGPDAFDCFGLVSHVSERLFYRIIPRDAAGILQARRVFAPAVMPIDGARDTDARRQSPRRTVARG